VSSTSGLSLAPPTPSPYQRLNPLTKAAVAVATTAAVLASSGYAVPLGLLAAAVIPPALAARVGRRAARAAVLATLPIAVSVVAVSTFGLPGDVALRLGPLVGSLEGFNAGARVALRLFVMAASLAVFGLTTPPSALIADLERRGVSPRLAFAATATLGAVPALVDQANVVRDAQRARALDIDRGLVARLRGIAPLIGPVVVGTLHATEARALALEARAFGRPGRRDLLWAPSDSGGQRAARWLLLVATAAFVGLAVVGGLPRLP
jgi:energy-coupling factor transport system permease protein